MLKIDYEHLIKKPRFTSAVNTLRTDNEYAIK